MASAIFLSCIELEVVFYGADTTAERLIRIRWPLSLPTYSPSWLHFNTCSWFLVIPTSLSIPFRTLYSNSIVNIYSGSFSGLSSVTTLWVVPGHLEMIILIDHQVIFLKQDYPDSFFVVCGVAKIDKTVGQAILFTFIDFITLLVTLATTRSLIFRHFRSMGCQFYHIC